MTNMYINSYINPLNNVALQDIVIETVLGNKLLYLVYTKELNNVEPEPCVQTRDRVALVTK